MAARLITSRKLIHNKKIQAVSVKEMQRLDRWTINRCGIPSCVLMENAGGCVAREALKALKRKKNKHIVILCGVGNNGGDGFVAARHLVDEGLRVQVFLIGSKKKLKGDAALNYRILSKNFIAVKEVKGLNRSFNQSIKKAGLLIDALFGTGLSRPIDGFYAQVIGLLNQRKENVLSVDIPSGLDGTTGVVFGVAIKAARTVTFGFAKKGFFLKQGPRHTGKIIVVDIGIPKILHKSTR